MVEDIPEGNWDGVTTESVYEGENFKVTFLLIGHWEGGYSAKVKIENTGDSVIENWGLGFEYPDTISELSNAVIDTQENEIYVIKNAGYNANILSGGIEGEYVFYVYNFSGSPDIKSSGATVKVFNGNSNEPAYEFPIPLVGNGRYWTVFKYDSKTRRIKLINKVSNSV